MKSSVAITLIIMGTLLVALPPLSDAFYVAKVSAALARPGITSVNIEGKMDDLYRIGCMLLGAAIIVPAIAGSIGGERKAYSSALSA